jgi:signal recognition particle receptor subunit beta
VRAWWRDYFVEADAIVFVVDSSDTERLNEAREVLTFFPSSWRRPLPFNHPLFARTHQELAGLLAEPSLRDLKGLIVLGNKSDLQGSLNSDQLISALALQDSIEEVRPTTPFHDHRSCAKLTQSRTVGEAHRRVPLLSGGWHGLPRRLQVARRSLVSVT